MNRPRILVVEDDPAVLEGIRGLLEISDYDVLTATNGLEALDVLETSTPHLIVSDIMMPRMDGFELYMSVRTRSDWTEVPFIFLTARGDKRDIHRGKELGVDDYVIKPFDENDLLVAIRNKLTRRAQLANARQIQISELKHAILNTLNHEFRTPLTHIASYITLLRETVPEASSEEFSRFLQVIEAGTTRLQRLVEDFILLAELRTGEAQQAFEKRCTLLDELPSLLGVVAAQHQAAAAERGLSVELALPPGPLPPVRADREFLTDAVTRLMENALKFSSPGAGPVVLSAEAADNQVLIHVADHGPGLRAEELDQVFELFYQSGRSKREQQGTGSGLTIAYEIVHMHGGTLTATSTLGQGSIFTIALPAAGPATKA